MTDIILSYFPKEYDIYIEGFGGGASILFAKEPKGVEIYNDLGSNVYSLFKVLSNTEYFIRLKRRMDVTPYSARLREEFKEKLREKDLNILDRAYYFLCVNRMSFNGVGGFSNSGNVVRRGMSKSVSDYLSMIDKLPQIHERLSRVIIENRNIFEILDKCDRPNVFMYLDPPYVHSTRLSSQTYEIEMDDEEHIRLVDRLNRCRCKVLLSGYDNEIYRGLSTKFEKIDFASPNAKSSAVESLWKNY